MVNASFAIENHAAYVTVEREEKLNAIDSETKQAIIEELQSYQDDDDVRAVVIQSVGDRAFSAGGTCRRSPKSITR
jgi:enoyl-CoA hydratase/carnithine racemase